MRTPSETISIRMDQEQLKLLDRRRHPFGDSRGEHIKRMIIDQLLRVEQTQLSDNIVRLRAALDEVDDRQDRGMTKLNENLRRLTYVLLTTAGGLVADEAEQAARRVFPPTDGGR